MPHVHSPLLYTSPPPQMSAVRQVGVMAAFVVVAAAVRAARHITLKTLDERNAALRDLYVICQQDDTAGRASVALDECKLYRDEYDKVSWFRKLFDRKLIEMLDVARTMRRMQM